MASTKVAVVTGSNKGLGFGIVRGLCKKFDGVVYLTARDVGRGQAAVAELEKEGLKPRFHQLDISNPQSITTLRDYLKEKYGGLDILVNNAAIAYKMAAKEPFGEQAEVSVKVNFCDNMNVCDILFPILRPHARVVHISSMVVFYCISKCSPEVKTRLLNTKTVQEIKDLVAEFVQAAKEDQHSEKGWPNLASGTAKMCVTQATGIQQRQFDSDSRQDIVVNCCCPGHIKTDMSSHKGEKTIDEGADTPIYLALLPPNATSPKGNFVTNREIKPWNEE